MFPEQYANPHEATDEAFLRAARFGSAASSCFRRRAGVRRVAAGIPIGAEAPLCSLSARTRAGPMAEIFASGDAGETRDRSTAPANDAGDGEGAAASAAGNSTPGGQLVEHGAESANDGTVAKKKKASLDDSIKEMKEKRQAMQNEKKKLASELRLASRKRRRLKKRASQLSVEDLFDVCRIKELNPESMEDAVVAPPASES